MGLGDHMESKRHVQTETMQWGQSQEGLGQAVQAQESGTTEQAEGGSSKSMTGDYLELSGDRLRMLLTSLKSLEKTVL